ncbi:MAG: hypothetical protein ABI846_01550 [Rudaea sp.]
MNRSSRFISVLALVVTSCVALAAAAPLQGSFKANGQEVALTHVLAQKGESSMDRPVIQLVLSEKDASASKSPAFEAQAGHFGAALAVRLTKGSDGWDVIGTEFAHPALQHSGASGTGMLEVKDVAIANGEISGHLVTTAKADLFGEPIVVDLTFHVKQP